jgi:hypothetical protein
MYKNLFGEHEVQYDMDAQTLEVVLFIYRKVTVIYALIFVPQKGGLSIDGHKFSYSAPTKGEYLYAF